ncbi:MAG: S8 family serine peptidase [Planctomycetia bacterium]|nr:S8 family serine peptidase [Planctomycetia bacterium]
MRLSRFSTSRAAKSSRPRRSMGHFEQFEDRRVLAAAFVDSEILVQFADNVDEVARAGARAAVQSWRSEELRSQGEFGGPLERISLGMGVGVERAIAALVNRPDVLYVEPNWILHADALSNDPGYVSGQLWGMYGDDLGVAVGPSGTTNAFGSQAEKAWDAGFTGSNSIAIGIVDEGFDITHPDLAANVWVNPFDPRDGIDNDGNGYVDDVNGWDFYNNDNSVYDGAEDDHGTHVAGTIAGVGGNGVGVAGVTWSTTLISTKFLGAAGGTTANAVKALDYLTGLKSRHGINVVASNNSWGGGGYSSALHSAIIRGANAGILFVSAAGNGGSDGIGDSNDSVANYPSNYSTLQGTTTTKSASFEAVIAVAAITSSGSLASYSNYGSSTVDIGAPGNGIYSTLPDGSYGTYSGTSMATPHVTGAAALYAAAYPTASAKQIRDAILGSAKPTTSLAGKTVTGGRLDVAALVQQVPIAPPTLAISSVAAVESIGKLTFTITLSSPVSSKVTVKYSTSNGTAVAGRNGDYTATSGTLTFNPGETAKTISVSITNDSLVEVDETFFVTLSGASGAGIAVAKATGTIVNDDGLSAAKIAAFATLGSFVIDDDDADNLTQRKLRR